jgi:hypothetical protein
MNSLLHPLADSPRLDVSAFVYSSLRLPPELYKADVVLLGQRTSVFNRYGYAVKNWQPVSAKARRRRAYFDGKRTLALYIASRSDIDDILPALTAYQIEWNKLHRRLKSASEVVNLLSEMHGQTFDAKTLDHMAERTGCNVTELTRIVEAWQGYAVEMMRAIAANPKYILLDLLAGSLADYRKAMLQWWRTITDCIPAVDFTERRVYFVSSNAHSVVNLWAGHGPRNEAALMDMLAQPENAELNAEYEAIVNDERPVLTENYLYYLLKKYQQRHGEAQQAAEQEGLGICEVESADGFDLTAQVIPINGLNPAWLDSRLQVSGYEHLTQSDALIVNIDYPLGMAAFDVLTRLSENVKWVSGVYIMGKAATLNGRIGDVMIPTVVHDEHSNNTYLFDNCFSAAELSSYLQYGNVLDNQKSVTVPGTFLQNEAYMSVFYNEGYTDIEMEAGPYLSAIYELVRPKRHPQDEIINLHGTPLDIGIIHYASDTPLTKGANLGAGSLSYRGIDPTYAATIAILRRIMMQELTYMQKREVDRT